MIEARTLYQKRQRKMSETPGNYCDLRLLDRRGKRVLWSEMFFGQKRQNATNKKYFFAFFKKSKKGIDISIDLWYTFTEKEAERLRSHRAAKRVRSNIYIIRAIFAR